MDDEPRGLDLEVPAELEPGAYAHGLHVWHTVHDFTLDFAVRPNFVSESRLTVARVRLPARLMFHVIRTLNAQLAHYEAEHGELQHEGEG